MSRQPRIKIVKTQSCCQMALCETFSMILENLKMPYSIRKEVQSVSTAVEGEISTNVPESPDVPNITVQTSAVSVFNQMSLAIMAEEQTKDSVLGLVTKYVLKGESEELSHF